MTAQDCTSILRECGLELRDNNLKPALHTSAALFSYKLNDLLQNNQSYIHLIEDFVNTLLADHDNISLYLDPVEIINDDADSSNGDIPASQGNSASIQRQPSILQAESLIRLMLDIDLLQPQLIGILLDKLPEFIGDDDNGSGGGDIESGSAKISVKILRQLRWLDYVVDSAILAEKLLDTLGFVSPEIQREIIVALPDIISDSDHIEASKVLSGMLNESPELMLSILETLGSLECPPGIQQECRDSVVRRLVSADPSDVPVMVKFLLQSVTPDLTAPILLRIRKRLDLVSIVLTEQQNTKGKNSMVAPDMLIFDVISTSLKSHKHLREAWLKVISDDSTEVGSHTILDVTVLFILYGIATMRKRVESVLKAKITTISSVPIAYTPELMEIVIPKFSAVFSAHFSELLSISNWLIRTSPIGSQGSKVASAILVSAFGSMGMFQRQEIAGELTAHIGSGNNNEIDTAARTCLMIAQKHSYELRPFAIFIKGLLEYIENMSIEHIRAIFDTLGILSTLNTTSGDESMFNELYIFVRKQLSSIYPKYNRIGIVGTVSLLRHLGTSDNTSYNRVSGDPDTAAGSSSQGVTANVQALRRAGQLLEMLIDTGRHQSWTFLSMTYDELAHIVETKGLHNQLLKWLYENVFSDFAEKFIGDPDILAKRYYLIDDTPDVSLSLDSEETTVLDILNNNKDAVDLKIHDLALRKNTSADNEEASEAGLPSRASGNNARLKGSILSCLPSVFRLIQVCEKALGDGSLAEVDALLVCGVYLVPPIDTSDTTDNLTNEYSSTALPSYSLVDNSDNKEYSASNMISGDHLACTDNDDREELLAKIKKWPVGIRRVLCSSLYVTVNWLREIINAFAESSSSEIYSKVIQRANQLYWLQNDLVYVALSLSGTVYEFDPLAAGLLPDISDNASVRYTLGEQSNNVFFGRKSARQASTSDVDTNNADEGSLDDNNAENSEEKAGSFVVDLDELGLSEDESSRLTSWPLLSQRAAAAGASTSKSGHKKKKGADAEHDNPRDIAAAPRQYLRELTLSSYKVLLLDFWDNSENTGVSLFNACGLSLVLDELYMTVNSKLKKNNERRFPPFKSHSASAGTKSGSLATFGSNIDECNADDVMNCVVPIFPSLLRYLACCLTIRARFHNDISATNVTWSEDMVLMNIETVNDVTVVEKCIDTLFQIIATVIQWDGLLGTMPSSVPSSSNQRQMGDNVSGIAMSSRNNALTRLLGMLAVHGTHTDDSELKTLERDVLARRAFDSILRWADMVNNTSRVILILRMAVAIRDFTHIGEKARDYANMSEEERENTMDGKISNLAHRIMMAGWGEANEMKSNELEYVFTQRLMRYPHDKIALVHQYATEMLPVFVIEGLVQYDGVEIDGSALNKATFPHYYKVITQVLTQHIKGSKLGDKSGNEVIEISRMVSESWFALAKITQKMTMTGTVDQRNVLLFALRGGYALIDQFTKVILPFLDRYFLMHRDQVLGIFEKVQKSTRVLQNICNHSKVVKDTKLQSAVPQMKRRLESLILQVMALMEHNDCMDAFDVGNLKHRDIRGQVVSSQIPQSQEESESEEEPEEEEEEENEERGHRGRSSKGRPPVSTLEAARNKKNIVQQKQLLVKRRAAAVAANEKSKRRK